MSPWRSLGWIGPLAACPRVEMVSPSPHNSWDGETGVGADSLIVTGWS